MFAAYVGFRWEPPGIAAAGRMALYSVGAIVARSIRE